MYNVCKKIILSGNYDKKDMDNKINIFLLKDKITAEEYEELLKLMGIS